MSRTPTVKLDSVSSAVDGGTHQSIARIDLLLSALGESPERGLRLAEVCKATGLGKATAHRLLAGLIAYRLVDFDEESSRYLVGFKIFSWASGVGNRYGLLSLVRPCLVRLVERFQDAVYLIVRKGDEAVCVERLEGEYPIKALVLRIGGRRPLGIGAGAAAILAQMPEAEQRAILKRGAAARQTFGVSDRDLQSILLAARREGFTVVDGKIVPGICTVGAAINLDNGEPVAAISVSTISARMPSARRLEIARALREEIANLHRDNPTFFRTAHRSSLLGKLGT